MEDNCKVMDLAYEAGSILLENGAEISRVEETMSRIASHFGVEDNSFFVLSNGITATAENYARTKFIPIKGACLDKVVAVNQLSRDVTNGNCTIEELEKRLKQIRAMKNKSAIEQILGSAFGSAAFCIIFGGSLIDSAASFVAGLLLWIFVYFVGNRRLSYIISNVAGGLLATLMCVVMFKFGFGEHIGNMVIGALIPLIPGIPFTNGIRDLANEDYIAGITRLSHALIAFICIALGVAVAFTIDSHIAGEIQNLDMPFTDKFTATFGIQIPAAFIGTVAFAILFGVPRKYYIEGGLCGAIGWILYLILLNYTEMSPAEMVFLSTSLVTLVALVLSIWRKCPITVFLICGIFPLVPGAGIFWTSYNIVANKLSAALYTGFTAMKVTVAIAFGILFVNELKKIVVSK